MLLMWILGSSLNTQGLSFCFLPRTFRCLACLAQSQPTPAITGIWGVNQGMRAHSLYLCFLCLFLRHPTLIYGNLDALLIIIVIDHPACFQSAFFIQSFLFQIFAAGGSFTGIELMGWAPYHSSPPLRNPARANESS